MFDRKVNYRKKLDRIVLEGISVDNKPILIWTLPEANHFVMKLCENTSFLPNEKREEIHKKYLRLKFRVPKDKKEPSKVRIREIRRTFENDNKTEEIKENDNKEDGSVPQKQVQTEEAKGK